jgi:hypothetical protein
MNRRLGIALLTLVLLVSLASLFLYDLGEFFLSSTFEAVSGERREKSMDGNAPAEPYVPQEETEARDTADAAEGEETEALPEAAAGGTEAERQAGPVPEASAPSGQAEESLSYSEEEMAEIQGSISAADKMTASMLVLSRLSPEDIGYLYGLLEDGLTPEEKNEAKEFCYDRFSDEEIAQIQELYSKYADDIGT